MELTSIRVKRPEWHIPSWGIIAYLIIDDYLHGRDLELAQLRPDKEFEKTVTGYIETALEGGDIPAAIAPAIWNLVDDLKAGRELAIRAGDYITIQNHLRAG